MEKQFKNIYMKRFFYFNLYVIKGKNGDILIDTGFIFQRKKIKAWLDNFNIKLIILTHAHIDHVWNAAYFKKIYNCDVAISQNDIKYLDNSKIKTKSLYNFFIPCTFIMKLAMKLFKQKDIDITIKLKDNQILNKYNNELKIISLPGHTYGSIGIIYKDYVFCGDAAVYRRGYIEPAYQNQDNKSAIESFFKLLKLNPKVIFLGHDKYVCNDKLKESYDIVNNYKKNIYKKFIMEDSNEKE